AVDPEPHVLVAQLDQVSDLGGGDERDQARLAIARAGAELRHAAKARARPLDHAARGLGDAVAARLETGRVLDQIDTALQARRQFAARHGWLQELTHDQPLAASAGVRASGRARGWLAACSCAWDRAALSSRSIIVCFTRSPASPMIVGASSAASRQASASMKWAE